jgi:hypothetical protein
MYERKARDLSEELFNSVYDDMYALAEKQQKSIYASQGKKGYYVGECQTTFNAFCMNVISLGEAMDFIRLQKVYANV